MQSMLMEIERVLNTLLIIESGMIALAGVINNRELVTSKPPEDISDYNKIITIASHTYLDAYRFIIYFMSILILVCLAYFTFVEIFKFRFLLTGIMALTEIFLISRFLRIKRAYLSAIDLMMEKEENGDG